MASYVLEGFIGGVLANSEMAAWLRKEVEFAAIPFVDKDGVEQGDQGKNRRPHDHNRDYAGASQYPSVDAIRSWVPEWSEGKLRVVFDLHCPYIRGRHNDVIYIVGSSDPAVWEQQRRFGQILERVCQGPLPYAATNNLPFGSAWNTAQNYAQGKSSSQWAVDQPTVKLAACFEIPYAEASGQPVTAASARVFGADLARALQLYLSSEE
jgi:hypothetical protein